MKQITKLFLLNFLILKFLNSNCSKLSNEFSDVILNLFIKNEIKFDVYIFGNQTIKLKEITTEIMRNSQITTLNHIQNPSNQTLNQSAIILFEKYENALNFIETVQLLNEFPMDLKYLFYIEKISKLYKFTDQKIPVEYFGDILNFAYFIVESKKKIKIKTFEWFSESSCGKVQLLTLDVFNKKSKIWKNSLRIPGKFKNFNNCMIIYRSQRTAPHSYINKFTGQPEGLVPEISKAVAQKGNFTIYFQIFSNSKLFPKDGKILTPQVSCAPMMITSGDFMGTSTYGETIFLFVTTPGEKYSSYEKLLLPFDDETWIYLEIILGISLFVIFLINLMPKIVRENFYGVKVKNPAYNVFGSIFGISQSKIPGGNFARILLIYFVMFCLIFRTAYQGEKILINLRS